MTVPRPHGQGPPARKAVELPLRGPGFLPVTTDGKLSTFVNCSTHRSLAGEPTLEIHPQDASTYHIQQGQRVRVWNNRGSFQARALVADTVRPGVVVALSIWWNKLSLDGRNVNQTTSSGLADMGGGAVFFDNLVRVESA